MRAESFYRFGAALGLTQSALDALLTGGEPPAVLDVEGEFVIVSINPRDAVPGCGGVDTLVRRGSMNKWMKELDRLRKEEAR